MTTHSKALEGPAMTQDGQQITWVPVYVERAICDLIPDTGHAREIARVAWAWDDDHPGYENSLYRWQNEAIRQRRDLIALQEFHEYEQYPEPESAALRAELGQAQKCLDEIPSALKLHGLYIRGTPNSIIQVSDAFKKIDSLRAELAKAAEELARVRASNEWLNGAYAGAVELAGNWKAQALRKEAEVDSLRDQLARERERHRWREIKEGCEMPKNGHDVLILREGGVIDRGYYFAVSSPIDGWYFRGNLIEHVTHWKPMPEPPALPETKLLANPAPADTPKESK